MRKNRTDSAQFVREDRPFLRNATPVRPSSKTVDGSATGCGGAGGSTGTCREDTRSLVRPDALKPLRPPPSCDLPGTESPPPKNCSSGTFANTATITFGPSRNMTVPPEPGSLTSPSPKGSQRNVQACKRRNMRLNGNLYSLPCLV